MPSFPITSYVRNYVGIGIPNGNSTAYYTTVKFQISVICVILHT